MKMTVQNGRFTLVSKENFGITNKIIPHLMLLHGMETIILINTTYSNSTQWERFPMTIQILQYLLFYQCNLMIQDVLFQILLFSHQDGSQVKTLSVPLIIIEIQCQNLWGIQLERTMQKKKDSLPEHLVYIQRCQVMVLRKMCLKSRPTKERNNNQGSLVKDQWHSCLKLVI